MDDIVLVTAESVRYDHVDAMEYVSSFDVSLGITGAHYTRPSLASVHSSSVRAAIQTRVVEPTLAETLRAAGYTCIGLSTSPQADERFGFDVGFDTYDNYVEPTARGSILERIAFDYDLVGRAFNRLFPRHERRADVPTDRDVLARAVEAFDDAPAPRFLWVHMMESHRPYGRDARAISPALDRKAKYSPERLTDAEAAEIRSRYRDALARVDRWIEGLLDDLDSDPTFAFAGDHGEGFGEHGYYFHPPQLRRVDDELVQVPVVVDGVDVPGRRLSLLDLAPTLVSTAGIEVPAAWDGNDVSTGETDHAVTVAPWRDRATVAWQDFERKLVAADAEVTLDVAGERVSTERTEVDDEMRRHLRDLGYVDAG